MGYFKTEIPTCKDCRHADEYTPYFTYRWSSPRCSVHHHSIKPDDIMCDDFQAIGTNSFTCGKCDNFIDGVCSIDHNSRDAGDVVLECMNFISKDLGMVRK